MDLALPHKVVGSLCSAAAAAAVAAVFAVCVCLLIVRCWCCDVSSGRDVVVPKRVGRSGVSVNLLATWLNVPVLYLRCLFSALAEQRGGVACMGRKFEATAVVLQNGEEGEPVWLGGRRVGTLRRGRGLRGMRTVLPAPCATRTDGSSSWLRSCFVRTVACGPSSLERRILQVIFAAP